MPGDDFQIKRILVRLPLDDGGKIIPTNLQPGYLKFGSYPEVLLGVPCVPSPGLAYDGRWSLQVRLTVDGDTRVRWAGKHLNRTRHKTLLMFRFI